MGKSKLSCSFLEILPIVENTSSSSTVFRPRSVPIFLLALLLGLGLFFFFFKFLSDGCDCRR